ncbi:MAG TPA: AAA family ATPase [Candidatus Woesearchaeota archaeon]|nr:AAA family ATPase [Candidatus Woesearchaeota archaeon]
MRILISGTPGTGKSTAACLLAKSLGAECLSITNLVKEKNLALGYNRKLRTWDVDENRLKREIERCIRKNHKIFVEGHLSHIVSHRLSDLCIVLRTEVSELFKRLKKRKYPLKKIQENIQAEIFNTCYEEAKENKHKVLVIDTTSFSSAEKTLLKDFIYELSLQS